MTQLLRRSAHFSRVLSRTPLPHQRSLCAGCTPRKPHSLRSAQTSSRPACTSSDALSEEAPLRPGDPQSDTPPPSQPRAAGRASRASGDEPRARVAREARAAAPARALVDTFARVHTYLRISLTERCNLRCSYCMPVEGVPLAPSSTLLTGEEVVRLASVFAASGVTKVRLTGGEPFVRRDFFDIAHAIGHHPRIRTLAVTTNGIVLKRSIPRLLAARVSALNVSLDTLVAPKFSLITRRDGHSKVLDGLFAALDADFASVKLNVVVMKGVNDDELVDFCDMTREHKMDVRFIEFMPFGGNRWNDARFLSYADMLKRIGEHYGALERASDASNDTSKHYRVPGYRGRIGFITSMTDHFCGTCNRLRVTADGNIKVCLFGSDEVSLRDAMRSGATDDELTSIVRVALGAKHFALGGNRDMYDIAGSSNREMIRIGG